MRKEIQDKSHIHIHQDATDLSILVFKKSCIKDNKIMDRQQGEYLVQFGLVIAVQLGMLLCQGYSIYNEGDAYALTVTKIYVLVLVKIVCSQALHLWLYPHIYRSMSWMKYINNHEDLFDKARIPFMIAFTQMIVNILAEMLNIYMLAYQHSVEHAIIHFVALEVIIEIPHFYS